MKRIPDIVSGKLSLVFVLAFGMWTAIATAQSFQAATSNARQELERAQTEYRTLTEEIAKAKLPLIEQIDLLQSQVRDRAAALNEFVREQVNLSRNQVELDREVRARQVESQFISGRLRDYSRSFLFRVHPSELQQYEEPVQKGNDRVEGGSLTLAEEMETRLEVVGMAVERLDRILGGTIYEGSALSVGGGKIDGRYALLGPSALFAATDGSIAGVTTPVTEQGVKPTVVDTGQGEGIRNLIENKEGLVPMDPTGKALKIGQSKDSVAEHLAKGGIVGYWIVALGILGLLIAAFKWFEISRFNVPQPQQIDSILDDLLQGKTEEAEQEARSIPGTAGEMMLVGVQNFHRKRRALEELLYEKLLAIRPKLERFLPFLAVTAAAAPLMGLLGTVMGMIKTFKLITEFGTGDAKSLSTGISEALVTTELGLIVAIPVLIVHGILVRMARGRIGRMEAAAMAFLNGVSTKEIKIKEAA